MVSKWCHPVSGFPAQRSVRLPSTALTITVFTETRRSCGPGEGFARSSSTRACSSSIGRGRLEVVVGVPLPKHDELLIYLMLILEDVALLVLYQQLELLLGTQVVWCPTWMGRTRTKREAPGTIR